MKTKQILKGKTPIIRIDHALDKYENMVLFPEKLAKANEMLNKKSLHTIKKQMS